MDKNINCAWKKISTLFFFYKSHKMATIKATVKRYTFSLLCVNMLFTSFTKESDNKVGPVSLVDV